MSRVDELVEEVTTLLAEPPHVFDADFAWLHGTPPYRALIKLGKEALPRNRPTADVFPRWPR